MYSRYNIPKNYSGNRFKEPLIETETKFHKPSPSYTSTRTSVSPTFQNALNEQSIKKTGDGVYDFAESDSIAPNFDGEEFTPPIADFQDEQKNPFLGDTEQDGNGDFSSNEKEKGQSPLGKEILPLVSKVLSNINHEDLILISLILLFVSEENSEAKSLILPLMILYFYK